MYKRLALTKNKSVLQNKCIEIMSEFKFAFLGDLKSIELHFLQKCSTHRKGMTAKMKLPTKTQYGEMVKKESPNSNSLKNSLLAFLFGGSICLLGEIFYQWYVFIGMGEKESRTLVAITLIFISAVLTILKIYDNIAKYAGAGIVVPITGFANSVVASAIEFHSEGCQNFHHCRAGAAVWCLFIHYIWVYSLDY